MGLWEEAEKQVQDARSQDSQRRQAIEQTHADLREYVDAMRRLGFAAGPVEIDRYTSIDGWKVNQLIAVDTEARLYRVRTEPGANSATYEPPEPMKIDFSADVQPPFTFFVHHGPRGGVSPLSKLLRESIAQRMNGEEPSPTLPPLPKPPTKERQFRSNTSTGDLIRQSIFVRGSMFVAFWLVVCAVTGILRVSGSSDIGSFSAPAWAFTAIFLGCLPIDYIFGITSRNIYSAMGQRNWDTVTGGMVLGIAVGAALGLVVFGGSATAVWTAIAICGITGHLIRALVRWQRGPKNHLQRGG